MRSSRARSRRAGGGATATVYGRGVTELWARIYAWRSGTAAGAYLPEMTRVGLECDERSRLLLLLLPPAVAARDASAFSSTLLKPVRLGMLRDDRTAAGEVG